MRRDKEPALIPDCEEGAVLSHRFCTQDVQPGGLNLSTVERISEICLTDDRASSQVQEDRFRLHPAECLCVHDAFCVFIQRRMDGENIGFSEKRVKINLMIALLRGSSRRRVIDHSRAEQTGDIRNSPADGAETKDSPGHAVQLVECLPEMGENTVVDVPPLFDIVVIISQVLHQVEQNGKGMLRHGFCGVACNIAPFNPARCEIVLVQVVRAGCCDTDKLQFLRGPDRAFVDQNLIYDQYVRVSGALRNFFGGCEGILYDLPKLFERCVVNIIAKCFGVQKYDFHKNLLVVICPAAPGAVVSISQAYGSGKFFYGGGKFVFFCGSGSSASNAVRTEDWEIGREIELRRCMDMKQRGW